MKRVLYFLISISLIYSCKKNPGEVPPPTSPVPKIPIVLTNPVSNISLFSVTFSGKVVDTGDSKPIEVGFVADTLPNPSTTKNLNKFIGQADNNGIFSATIINIPADKPWYVKAYAINNQGTGYGNEITFRSLPEKAFWGNVNLTTQQEVNDFGANNYTKIHGSVFISGSITDLSPLQSIVMIGNGFEINNTGLTSLNGLHNLEMVGFDFIHNFRIKGNHLLTNLTGLSKLKIVNGTFEIIDDDGLINLTGLDNFTTQGNFEFRIDGCANLISITGLEKMKEIYGDILIKDNPLLNNLDAWNNLTLVSHDITILNNTSLQRVNCFTKLKWINGIRIVDNPSLLEINGFINLDTILETIQIRNNPLLTNISSLSNITTTDYIQIENNLSLQDIEGLRNIQSVTRVLNLTNNPSITNLQGLRRLKYAANLSIANLSQLINLAGLDSLTTLTGIFPAYLTIANNTQLQNLDALKKLTTVNGTISISGNLALSNFCGLKQLFLSGYNNTFTVGNNAVNPTPSQIVSSCP